jgi:hypothetical protein
MKLRFTNRNKMLTSFGHEFLVLCPSCSKRAKVLPIENIEPYAIYAKRRFICTNCGAFKEMSSPVNTYRNGVKISYGPTWKEGHITIGGPFDCYFGLPLFLQIPCCGHTLWAYNLEHLNYIEDYVKADLRDPHPYYLSVESRLPSWIKTAKNRQTVLKSIEKLKELLN